MTAAWLQQKAAPLRSPADKLPGLQQHRLQLQRQAPGGDAAGLRRGIRRPRQLRVLCRGGRAASQVSSQVEQSD